MVKYPQDAPAFINVGDSVVTFLRPPDDDGFMWVEIRRHPGLLIEEHHDFTPEENDELEPLFAIKTKNCFVLEALAQLFAEAARDLSAYQKPKVGVV